MMGNILKKNYSPRPTFQTPKVNGKSKKIPEIKYNIRIINEKAIGNIVVYSNQLTIFLFLRLIRSFRSIDHAFDVKLLSLLNRKRLFSWSVAIHRNS